MKERTIEEIHDKEIGHKKFSQFVDNAINDGHEVTEIKEYNEKFKFKMDGMPLEFDKNPKISMQWQLEQCYQLLWYRNKLEEIKNGKNR